MSAGKKTGFIVIALILLVVGGLVFQHLNSLDEAQIDASVKRCLAAIIARDAARLVEEIDPAYFYVNQNTPQDHLINDEKSRTKFDNALFSNKSKHDLYGLALSAFSETESVDIRLLNSKVVFGDGTAEAFPVFRATIHLRAKKTPEQPAGDVQRVKETPRDFPQEGPAIHKFRLKYKKDGERWLITEIEELRDEPASIE